MELTQGSRLANRFKVVGCLGNGAWGPLFLAEDSELEDSLVSLRAIQNTEIEGANPEIVKHRMMRSLEFNHERIVQVLEYVELPELKAASMEYFPGKEIFAWIDYEEVDALAVIHVLSSMAEGLSALHQADLFHGNLTNESILIQDGEVKIDHSGLCSAAEFQNGFRIDLLGFVKILSEVCERAKARGISLPSRLTKLVDRITNPEARRALVSMHEVSSELEAIELKALGKHPWRAHLFVSGMSAYTVTMLAMMWNW